MRIEGVKFDVLIKQQVKVEEDKSRKKALCYVSGIIVKVYIFDKY